jgi:hypothetical protein
MKIVELILGDDELTGIEAISIVENPAIEEDFIALKKEMKVITFTFQKKQLRKPHNYILQKAINQKLH